MYKNIERYTARTIVSWFNPKPYFGFDDDNKEKVYIIIMKMDTLKTHSPIYCVMDNWGNMLNFTHTLEKIYLTGILWSTHGTDHGLGHR